MSLKDFLLFLGQADDGKEKPTVFGKLKRILDAIGNPSDSGDSTIFGKQNNLVKLTQREPIWNVTAMQSIPTSSSTNTPFSLSFTLPKNNNFVALAITKGDYQVKILESLSIKLEFYNGQTKTYSGPHDVSVTTNNGAHAIYLGLAIIDGKLRFGQYTGNLTEYYNVGEQQRICLNPNIFIKLADVKSVLFSGNSRGNNGVLDVHVLYTMNN